MPSAIIVAGTGPFAAALAKAVEDDNWSVLNGGPLLHRSAAADQAPSISGREIIDLAVVVVQPRDDVVPRRLKIGDELDDAIAAATSRKPNGYGPHARHIVVVADRRALVADTGDSGYGIAVAEVKAAVRLRALTLAPRSRVNAIVASLAVDATFSEILAAIELLEASPAMTGTVIEFG